MHCLFGTPLNLPRIYLYIYSIYIYCTKNEPHVFSLLHKMHADAPKKCLQNFLFIFNARKFRIYTLFLFTHLHIVGKLCAVCFSIFRATYICMFVYMYNRYYQLFYFAFIYTCACDVMYKNYICIYRYKYIHIKHSKYYIYDGKLFFPICI